MTPATAAPSPRDSGERLALHADRFFDSDPAIRRAARALYEETRDLPIVSPHGQVDPALLADDAPFPEPTALLITPDHYILRMLYSQGIPLESLRVPARDGTPVEQDARRVWQLFGDQYYLFRGTPTGVWLDHELHEVFGVRRRLGGATAADLAGTFADVTLDRSTLGRYLGARRRAAVRDRARDAARPGLAQPAGCPKPPS